MIDLKDAAKLYASLGWYVVADHGINDMLGCTCPELQCHRPGKHPRSDYKKREGTINPDEIDLWWNTNPNSNVAIVCGRSGLIVIDIDAKSKGYESLKRMEAGHGKMPETITALSGGGGMHLYYAHPGLQKVRNRVGLYPGIDVRADEGRIVAPPSRHKSGDRYRWESGKSPWDIAAAPIPRWLLYAIQNQKGTGTRRRKVAVDWG